MLGKILISGYQRDFFPISQFPDVLEVGRDPGYDKPTMFPS